MSLNGMSEDYNTFMNDLEYAIQQALYTRVRDGLIESLAKSARANVYSYPAKPYYMAKRRYMIADRENMSTLVNGTTLTLKNITVLQCGEPNEVDIVESGAHEWRQPGPRPFMEEGLQEYASSKALSDLTTSLLEQGFTIVY